MAITRLPLVRWSAARARALLAAMTWRPIAGTTKRAKRKIVKRLPRSIRRGYRRHPGLDWTRLDGILDWYLLGVVAGLGVADGTAAAGAPRSLVYALLALAAVAGAVALTALALPWWALAVFGVVALAAWLALRRLSPDALPAAVLASLALAALPALGYLAAAAAPVAGARLGRRAGSRYAGLRVLARD
jgi:hypothetical protein